MDSAHNIELQKNGNFSPAQIKRFEDQRDYLK